MTQIFNCPFCGHDEVVQVEVPRVIHDARTHAEYGMQAVEMECKDCFEHFVTPEQSDENDVRLADAKGLAIGAPSREAIKKLRDDWNITQEIAGTLFGGGKVAFCKYESGSIVPTQAMARLLALAVAGRITKIDLEGAAAGTLVKRKPTMTWSTASIPTEVYFKPVSQRTVTASGDKATVAVYSFTESLPTDANAFNEAIYDDIKSQNKPQTNYLAWQS